MKTEKKMKSERDGKKKAGEMKDKEKVQKRREI